MGSPDHLLLLHPHFNEVFAAPGARKKRDIDVTENPAQKNPPCQSVRSEALSKKRGVASKHDWNASLEGAHHSQMRGKGPAVYEDHIGFPCCDLPDHSRIVEPAEVMRAWISGRVCHEAVTVPGEKRNIPYDRSPEFRVDTP